MPRIRKKTSNRLKTHERHKLTKRIKESKRKKARDAKKSTQWKSRKPKDPGIPNDFPYKDQILAEVAEQRRVAAEEKERKKEEKKAARLTATSTANESGSESDKEEEEEEAENLLPKGLNVGAEAIASLSAKLVRGEFIKKPKPAPDAVEEDEEEDEVPVLINRDLPTLQSVLDKADVVVEVLDARDPLSFRSAFLEESVAAKGRKKGKKVVLVLNKIDAVPRESVSAWLTYLRTYTQYPTFAFRSASTFLPSRPDAPTKGKGKATPADDAIGAEGLLSCLADLAKAKGKGKELNVAVVGITNAGKSSLINSLLKQSALEVYTIPSVNAPTRTPSTTLLPQEASLSLPDGREVRFIDTPGLTFEYASPAEEAEEEEEEEGESSVQQRAKDILTRCRGRIERLKDPLPPVEHILARSNVEDLMLLYTLPAFEKSNAESFLVSIARSQQLVRKKGRLDTNGAAKIVLRDWNIGAFARWCMPPSTPPPNASPSKTRSGGKEKSEEEWYKNDESVLGKLLTKKELRKSGRGLVRIVPGDVEEREVGVDVPWEVESDSESEEGEGMDVDEEDGEGWEDVDDDDEDGEEEEEEEEEEEATPPPPPTSNKQKRKRGAEVAEQPQPPSKKVAFAEEPKGTKQARRAASKAGLTKEKAKEVTVKEVKETAKEVKVEEVKVKEVKKVEKVKPKKVANVAKKDKVKVAAKEGDGEAYDFGKFFN